MATPFRTRLYRRAGWAVICLAVALAAVPFTVGQFAKKNTQSKGPRALGLLELLPNAKARLRPICIMINGHFYDAGIYKADPVPMALDTGIVYEAEKTGESQGLFTIKNVLHNEAKNTFLAEGTWLPASEEQPKTATVKAETKSRPNDEDQPPVLRRPGSEPSKTENKPAAPATTAQNTPKPDRAPKDDEDSDRPRLRKPRSESPATQGQAPGTASGTPSSSSSTSSATATNEPSPEASEENDPNRPQLRRGPQPRPTAITKPAERPASAAKAKTQATSSPAMTNQRQEIPAISDADGPEPRPYTYDMTPKEEQTFRTKVLALASAQLLKDARQLEPELLRHAEESRQIRSGRVPAKPPVQPVWDDVQLRVFDVATNNEPILVLSAKAHLPERAKGSGKEEGQSGPTEFYVTVVAHSDLYGELKSLFAAVTDDRTLDVTPKYQLIDVVDADGDGRGEMLFRRTSDQGTSFVVYRVGADRLWPLYEGTAGQ